MSSENDIKRAEERRRMLRVYAKRYYHKNKERIREKRLEKHPLKSKLDEDERIRRILLAKRKWYHKNRKKNVV